MPDFTSLAQSLQTPSGLILLGSSSLLALLALFNPSGKPKLATSRWATPREQRHARRKAQQQLHRQAFNKVALTIGLPGERCQHLPDCQRGISMVGIPGVGKSYAIEPCLLSALHAGHPMLVYDFKYPSVAAKLLPLAQELGYDTHVFAPGFAESDICNPLDFANDASDHTILREFAKVFHRNGSQHGVQSEDPFFQEASENLTVGCLSLARASPFPDLAMAQAILRLPNLPGRLHHAVDLALWQKVPFDQLMSLSDSERTTASIVGTALGNFNQFMAPSLLQALLGPTTLPLDLQGKQLIVMGMDKQRRAAVAPLLASVLHLLIVRNASQARQAPLIVALDELPTLYLPDLVKWINEYRSQGVCFILGFQNLAQLEKTYGHQNARAIFGACATKILFNPGETESARVFSDMLGEEEIRYIEIARNRHGGKTSINRQPQRRTRKLMAPEEFVRLPTGTAVFLSPAISNKRQSGIPCKTRIRVSPSTVRLLQKSAAAWPRLRPLLTARSQPPPIDDAALHQRFTYAERLLPPLPATP